ncbi:hypothetical protein NMG29_32380 [Streptomyces cocklensis]|uniref:Uncharacterized protein n=1 Tax=Actinacidiphila cocklensis TaxID=887465 RepID=A0A9W4GSX6_9ACTN|nr:hypothetical protein [Actinacidiphila cocklensis]MDD1062841.1 hypothetical protein [Actinacidiphila cocklensis]CAG6394095.1 conserved hypothetical protein [Actinacidiphila cocklensis]
MTTTSAVLEPVNGVPLAQQPSAAGATSRGGTWSISTTGRVTLTGYLPPWADEEPSESDVPLEELSVKLIDLADWRPFDGQRMRIHNPAHADGASLAVEESLFDGHIACYPYREDLQERTPYANVLVVNDLWLNHLTPEDLTRLTAQLRAQADHIEKDVTPILEAARNDWTARQVGRANHVVDEPAGASIASAPIGTVRG